tara:strand:- start:1552 stop:2295 length:744 start_codon:yes stop_codon:yes gene_type:complete
MSDSKKIAIILHVYWIDTWGFFRKKLENLKTPFDLYITLCDEVPDISNKILDSFPNAIIYKYPNKGTDIGPFLLTFKKLRDRDYDYLIKLHAKKSENFAGDGYNGPPWKQREEGLLWRKHLVNALIASDKKLQKNISIFENQPKYKMCGCEKWIISDNNDVDTIHGDLKDLKDEYGSYQFVGGTMFMVDFKVFKELLTDEIIDEWYQQMPSGYKPDNTFTHTAERLLGKLIIDKGYKIKGVSCHDIR